MNPDFNHNNRRCLKMNDQSDNNYRFDQTACNLGYYDNYRMVCTMDCCKLQGHPKQTGYFKQIFPFFIAQAECSGTPNAIPDATISSSNSLQAT